MQQLRDGGLKYVGIFYNIISFQSSWIKFLGQKFFKFYSNFDVTKWSLNNFSRFYMEILIRWSKYLSFPVSLLSTFTFQILQFHKDIKVYGKCIYFKDFSKSGLNFVEQLFDLEWKKWEMENEHQLLEFKSIQWVLLIDVLKKNLENNQ